MERIFQTEHAFLDKGLFTNESLLEYCVRDVEPLLEERPPLHIYGKICRQNRNVGFFSDTSIGYKYSHKLMASMPLSIHMRELLHTVNTLFSTEYNGILVNKYMNGNDYISAHSDNETDLDPIGVIAISYGAERIFRIRNKYTKEIVYNDVTTHCSILHMGGDFQKLYTHEIPIQKKILEPRISFTFRKHNI